MTTTLSPPAAHHARARLVEHLERLRPGESACEAFLLTELAAVVSDVDALRDLLASIGAVTHQGGWRLSDGAPPGWWWQPCEDGGSVEYVLVDAWNEASEVNPYIAGVRRGAGWHVCHPQGSTLDGHISGKIADAEGKSAALRVCRLHGLFARGAVTA